MNMFHKEFRDDGLTVQDNGVLLLEWTHSIPQSAAYTDEVIANVRDKTIERVRGRKIFQGARLHASELIEQGWENLTL